jgi:hypothetical protein
VLEREAQKMPSNLAICSWLENTRLGLGISQSVWIFPGIEMVHMFGIVVLVGATSILDMRLLGLMLRDEPVSKLARATLRWAWISFTVMIVTGALMFVAEATKCYNSAPFRLKMVMIALAGLNALIFHSFAYRGVKRWEIGGTPFAAKFAGALSILFWFGIVAAGRWIAFY